MKNIFRVGDKKVFEKVVTTADQASFHGEVLHPVCSTFALARDMEWSSRLFFIEMKENDEEGVGTMITVEHKAPAFLGENLTFTATVEEISGPELTCVIEVKTNGRLIARGRTGQRMLKKERLKKLFERPVVL